MADERVTMKFSGWIISLLLLSLMIACSRKPELATSAAPEDFDGRWIGTWSWDTNSTTTLEISGTRIKVSRFPLSKANTEETVAVSSEGVVEFQKEWVRRAPCVLVLLPDPKSGVPIYITKDKNNLVYTVSESRDQRIIFARSTP